MRRPRRVHILPVRRPAIPAAIRDLPDRAFRTGFLAFGPVTTTTPPIFLGRRGVLVRAAIITASRLKLKTRIGLSEWFAKYTGAKK